MPSSSHNRRNKLQKTRTSKMQNQSTVLSRHNSATTRPRSRTSRRAIHDHHLQIARKRRSSESFACAGPLSPDLVSSKPDFIHYDQLLKRSQTQKYHYNRSLLKPTKSDRSSPRRCILRGDLRRSKRENRASKRLEEVDMVSNVRWLRLISEVESAVNSRPFKPMRSISETDLAPTLPQLDPLPNPYFPFPIPPSRLSITNKDLSKETESDEKQKLSIQSGETDPEKLQHQLDPRASTKKSDMVQRSLNIRQSQELQVGRWDHLVQLERRAREASEEGLRKASLNVSRFILSIPLPPSK